jgi:hypothetical protein
MLDPLRVSGGALGYKLLLNPGSMSPRDLDMNAANKAIPAVVAEFDRDELVGIARVFYTGPDRAQWGRPLATLHLSRPKSQAAKKAGAAAEGVGTTGPEPGRTTLEVCGTAGVGSGLSYTVEALDADFS